MIFKLNDIVEYRLNDISDDGFYQLDKDKQCYTKINDIPDELNAKVKELEAQAKVDNALKNLQDLCDTKTIQAKNYINGGEVTTEQLARYEEKYAIAKEYKVSGNYADVLKLEADMQGITVDKLAELIIKAGDAYKQALISFNAKIEAFRVKVKGLIKAGKIDRASMIIEKAKKLGADATDNDIAVLFKK